MTPTQRKAMEQAEATFRRYGDLHAAKPDPVKAASNYALSEQMAAALAEPAPEPVTYWDVRGNHFPVRPSKYDPDEHPNHIPLYAAPVREPVPLLTDEEISDIAISNPPDVHTYGRAIERAALQKAGLK